MRRIIIPLIIVATVFAWLVFRGGHTTDTGYTGTIEGRDIGVGSLTGGRVSITRIEEGDPVRTGDTLLVFETRLIDAQLREQRARVAQAQAALDRVRTGPRREEIERARIEWDRAERERKRREALLAQSLTSDEAYDAADAAAKAAFQTYEELRRGSRSEDERQAAASLDEAEGRLAYLQRQRDESVVRSPAAGHVQTFDLRPGDLVPANQPVATILPDGDLWVRVYVPENDIGAVHVGQSARFTVDTYPDRPFEARVIAVRDRAEYTPRNVQTADQRKDRVFAVKLSVAPAPELKPGMTATVRFE
jgi:HlyD family secretion protein